MVCKRRSSNTLEKKSWFYAARMRTLNAIIRKILRSYATTHSFSPRFFLPSLHLSFSCSVCLSAGLSFVYVCMVSARRIWVGQESAKPTYSYTYTHTKTFTIINQNTTFQFHFAGRRCRVHRYSLSKKKLFTQRAIEQTLLYNGIVHYYRISLSTLFDLIHQKRRLTKLAINCLKQFAHFTFFSSKSLSVAWFNA